MSAPVVTSRNRNSPSAGTTWSPITDGRRARCRSTSRVVRPAEGAPAPTSVGAQSLSHRRVSERKRLARIRALSSPDWTRTSNPSS